MANPRRENRPDVTINSIDYQVVPGEGNFLKQAVRTLIEEQVLDVGGATTRSDMRPVFQTSWAGGSRWENPLLQEQTIDAYLTSDGFDVVSTPGNLVALPDRSTPQATDTIHDNPFVLARTPALVYYFEPQKANLGLMSWVAGSLVAMTNDFGNGSGDEPIAMCWDPVLLTVFAIFSDGDCRYVTPDSAGGIVIDVGDVSPGTNIFMHAGRLMVYNGNTLQEITDPLGSPALVSVYDDGMGKDYLDARVDNATDPVIEHLWGNSLAFASAEGVYIVKNVIQNGLVTPFIYRVDRDNTGLDIGTPVATLPSGSIALDCYVHLGSLIVSTSSDVNHIMKNDISVYGHAQTTFYHYTDDSLGTIGSALGPNPDETVYKFLGADVARLWIGGFRRIWVYEAVRGGLHPFFEESASTAGGVWGSMVRTDASSAGGSYHHFAHDFAELRSLDLTADVAGDGDTHILESTYFDASLPAEQKSIVAVTLMTDGIVANETWTVTLSADDAAYGSSLTFDTDEDKTVRKNLGTPLQGYRFQYKLTYTASADVSTPSVIKGIIIWMVQGEFLLQWRLKLRLSDSVNIGNKVVRGSTQQTNLETLAANQAIVPFVDLYRGTSVSTNVRVQVVSIGKSSAQEGEADVILVEHPQT